MTRSIWLEKDGATVERKRRDRADVVIIGGGVTGFGCAYWLSKKEKRKVVVLEAGTVASGASGRNGGFVLRGIQSYYNIAVKRYGRDAAKLIYSFTEENQILLKEFASAHGNNFDLEERGSLLLACSLEELEDLSQSADLLKSDGFSVEYLKEDPLDRDFYGALRNSGDLAVHPYKLVGALQSASGVEVLENEAVSRIETGETVPLVVHSTSRVFECDRILIATNAYAPLMYSWFVDKIQPTRGQILVTQPLKKRLLDTLCYANYGWEYFRQLSDNRLLLGGCRQLFLDDELGYADMITKPVQQALENYLKDRFPDIAGVPIDYRFSGVMGFTQDGLPLVGELKKVPGAFFAVACNGHGLSYGLNMSKLLVEMAFEGRKFDVFAAERPTLSAKVSVAASQEKGP
jgi:glycine/D-amino acid oxidase-like deaminating enzyme